jgi:hypothetical protein
MARLVRGDVFDPAVGEPEERALPRSPRSPACRGGWPRFAVDHFNRGRPKTFSPPPQKSAIIAKAGSPHRVSGPIGSPRSFMPVPLPRQVAPSRK